MCHKKIKMTRNIIILLFRNNVQFSIFVLLSRLIYGNGFMGFECSHSLAELNLGWVFFLDSFQLNFDNAKYYVKRDFIANE